jgi:RNA polymerase-binding transcription factor DksA
MSKTKSVIGDVEIPEAPEMSKPIPGTPEDTRKLSRYMRNKLEAERLAKHVEAKKAAKRASKTGSKPDGKLSKRAYKVAQHKAAVKQILNKKQEPEAEKGGGSLYGACSFCGKPLTRPSSIAQGMGDFCAHNKGALPAGVSRDEHIASLTVTELPKDYVLLGEVYRAAIKAGYSGSRVIRATGGNGGIRPPLNEHFKIVFYKAKRYISSSALKHLKDLEWK